MMCMSALTCSWIEYEDDPVDGFGGKVAFKGLVDGDSVDVGVVNEPNCLIGKQLSIVL